jgi:hypothetical protein
MHNFRVASSTAEQTSEKLEALNNDFIKLMEKGGVSAVKAEPRFLMNAAALIRESVTDTFAMTDPTPIFCERRDARLGDKVEIEKRFNTLRVVRYAPQSQPLIYTPTKGKDTVSTAMFELPFGIELFKVMTRQYKIEDFVADTAEALTRHNVELVLTAVNTACQVGATDAKGRALRSVIGAADVTKVELDKVLRRLGPGATIFGNRYALDPIFDFGATTEVAKEEFRNRGQIGAYRGARMVGITDDYNEYYESWTTIGGKDWEKLLFVATPKKGATLLERDLSALAWEDLDAEKALFRSSIRFDHGIHVQAPYNYHVIELA